MYFSSFVLATNSEKSSSRSSPLAPFFNLLRATSGKAWVPIIRSGSSSNISFLNFLASIKAIGLLLNSFMAKNFLSDNLYIPPYADGVYLADIS